MSAEDLLHRFAAENRWRLLAAAALECPSDDTRFLAADLLRRFDLAAVRKVLWYVLRHDENTSVRSQAGESLLALEGQQLIDALADSLADETLPESERETLALDLDLFVGRIWEPDGRVVPALEQAFQKARSPLLRARIAWLLSWFDHEGIVEPMFELLESQPKDAETYRLARRILWDYSIAQARTELALRLFPFLEASEAPSYLAEIQAWYEAEEADRALALLRQHYPDHPAWTSA